MGNEVFNSNNFSFFKIDDKVYVANSWGISDPITGEKIFSRGEKIFAWSIFKDGNDLYISLDSDAIYVISKKDDEWTSPKKIYSGGVCSIFKEGNDLYIAANNEGTLVMTKKGIRWSKPKKIHSSNSRSIFKDGNKLYICGFMEHIHLVKLV